MNRSPFAGIALTFIIGILVAKYTNIPFIFFWITSFTFLIFSLIFLKHKKAFFFFVCLTVLFFGSCHLRNSQSLPHNHIYNFTPPKGTPVYVEGVVDSDPVTNSKVTSFLLKAERLIRQEKDEKICGRVLVKIFKKKHFSYGDRLLIEGNLYRVPYFRISRRLNYRDYLEQKHIYSFLSARKGSTTKLLDKRKGNSLKAFAFYMRGRMKRVIEDNMSPFAGSILNAIILGERSDLSKDLRMAMVQSGTVHIIAISGLHVGLVTLLTLIILKIFRIPKVPRYIIASVILIIYCILTGAKTPVVRVTIIVLITFFGYIIMRQVSIYNTLSLAALLILIFNPQELFNISFQLSFISIISIIALSPKIKALFPKKNGIIALLSGSLAAWIGLLPLTAYYFNIVSTVAVLANMVVIPYLLIVVGSGFTFLLIDFIYSPLSHIFSASCEISILFLVKFITLLARIPGAYFHFPNISLSLVICYYLVIMGLILLRAPKK